MVLLYLPLEERESTLNDVICLGQLRKHHILMPFRKRLVHSSGNDPCGMDSFFPEPLDDMTADLAQAHAIFCNSGIGLDEPDDIALCRIGVEAK